METKVIHNEECRIIHEFDRYYISESGQIYRFKALNNKERDKLKNGAEYISQNKLHYRMYKNTLRPVFCSLTNNEGKLHYLSVSHLVAKAFGILELDRDSKETTIEHIDGDKHNLHYSNLKISDKQFGNSKLSKDDVKKIKHLIKLGHPLKHIGTIFGVSDMQINRIKTGENWGNGKRKIKAPKAPFPIEDGKIRKYIAIFNSEKAPAGIIKKFAIKRNPEDPTDNTIIGIVKGYKLSIKHKNITRAKANIDKLNRYFFNS